MKFALAATFVVVLAIDIEVFRPYVGRAASALGHPNLWWLLIALVAELASMGAFAHVQHRMLSAGGARVPMRRLIVLTYAANAVSVTLPGGTALSSGYTFRRLRKWGASGSLASFTLISSGVLSTVSFALLGLVGGVMAGVQDTDPVVVAAGVLVVLVAVALVRRASRRPDALVHGAERLLAMANQMLRRDPDSGRARIVQFVDEFAQIKPRNLDWTAGLAYAALNWVADLACLVASCRAVGAHGATIDLAVIAYVAGMAVSSLSLLPGGLGVVDAAMILALTHGGLSPVSATAGVLLYRLISFVFIVVLGWVLWAGTWRLEHGAVGERRRGTVRGADVAQVVGVGEAGTVTTEVTTWAMLGRSALGTARSASTTTTSATTLPTTASFTPPKAPAR
jgi:uncharacterized protein (TIRG00374 family)